MRLIIYREKLAYEIEQAQKIIDTSSYPNQRVQVHIYCIAALLRKIMTRVTTARNIQVKVSETEATIPHQLSISSNPQSRALPKSAFKHITLYFLVSRIIHYFEFLPSVMGFDRPDLVRILSDKDGNLNTRELGLTEFLDAARQVVEDDAMLLKDLLKRSRKYLNRVVHFDGDGELRATETVETLIDLFDAVRNNALLGDIRGQIPVFYEQRDVQNMIKLIGAETREVEIRLLCEKLFKNWRPTPFKQFKFYEYQTACFELRGRMLDLESYDPEFPRIFMIRANDLLSVLVAIEAQLQADDQPKGRLPNC